MAREMMSAAIPMSRRDAAKPCTGRTFPSFRQPVERGQHVAIRSTERLAEAGIDPSRCRDASHHRATATWRRMSASFAFSRSALAGPMRSSIFCPGDNASSAGSENS